VSSLSGARAMLTAPARDYRPFLVTGRARALESYPPFSAPAPCPAQIGLQSPSLRLPDHPGRAVSGNLDARIELDPHFTAPAGPRAEVTLPHHWAAASRRCRQRLRAGRVPGRLTPLRCPRLTALVIPAGQRVYGGLWDTNR